jgi:uncharacterized protein (DUF305 family)
MHAALTVCGPHFIQRIKQMNSKTLLTALIALVIGLALGVVAAPRFAPAMAGSQMSGHDMSKMSGDAPGMDMSTMGTPKGDQSAPSQAFAKANAAMHTAMDIDYSGNTDVDFAKGMMPHHQGAIDMAKIELQYGKDAELRKLAEGIIAAQETEISFMKNWLAKNGK